MPKNLMFAAIIGFCLLQIIIVFACAVAVCQRGKDRKLSSDPSYRSGDLYYGRPSSIINTLRSLHTFRD